ncbi:MAG: sodium:proton antiporter NhaD, partial [Gammaproteobacteria bacterium]
MNSPFAAFAAIFILFLFPVLSDASEGGTERLDLTGHTVGFLALLVFVAAYALVILEEQLHLKKSKP